MEILPDSRLKAPKDGKYHDVLGWTVPVFCAVCGIPYGYVPEENCSFACWLCNSCSEAHGRIFGTMVMPDEVYWEKVREYQIEKYGRLLNVEEASTDERLQKLLRERT